VGCIKPTEKDKSFPSWIVFADERVLAGYLERIQIMARKTNTIQGQSKKMDSRHVLIVEETQVQ
jgi:hypothetical protein